MNKEVQRLDYLTYYDHDGEKHLTSIRDGERLNFQKVSALVSADLVMDEHELVQVYLEIIRNVVCTFGCLSATAIEGFDLNG